MPLFAALPPGLRRLHSSGSLLLSKGNSATAEASAKGNIVDDDLVEPNHIDPRIITFLTAADAACADGADFTSSQRIWSNTGGYTPESTATESKGQPRRWLLRYLPMPSLRCFLPCFPSWCRDTTNEQDDDRQRDLLAPSPTSLPLGYPYSNQGKGTPIVAQTKPSRSFSLPFLWSRKTANNMSGTATTTTSPVTTTESGSPIEPTQQRLSLNLVRPSIDVDLSGLFDTSCAIQSSEGVPAALLPSLPSAKVRHEEVLLTSGDGLPVWASKSVLEGYEEAKYQALMFIHGLTFTSDSTWAHILSDVNFHRSLLVPASKDSTAAEAHWLARPLIRYDLRHHGRSVASDTPSTTAAASHPISSPNLHRWHSEYGYRRRRIGFPGSG
ncbi:hypothetical protein BDZ90DRAFT_275267 [Jaminaea rosea]|uniref:Alpha/beta-hydrolase n=1 Tax=Jaminaea rosea TaxID=1569628 RepID=A0A316UMP7_9BASI|nr:hypothetical protein BDZ90DRAFT_275267 [Jaminaea rosea]PWN26536.1 hypothetical protein BDZ90DRAFT_275267 [Jaminaea rosea]